MEGFFQAAVCVLLPFFGTSLGAAAVFFLGCKRRPGLQRGLLGFSAGVMLAAMVWSLLQPAVDLADGNWFPAAAGFLLGIGGLVALDGWLSREENRPDRGGMLSFAVTLHNLPEGMAVGVALASMLAQDSPVCNFKDALTIYRRLSSDQRDVWTLRSENDPVGATHREMTVGRGRRGEAIQVGLLQDEDSAMSSILHWINDRVVDAVEAPRVTDPARPDLTSSHIRL